MKKRKLSDLKCPKCGEKPGRISEDADTSLEYALENDKYVFIQVQEGNIKGMFAYCYHCKYEWTLRGILQITDFEDYDEGYNTER